MNSDNIVCKEQRAAQVFEERNLRSFFVEQYSFRGAITMLVFFIDHLAPPFVLVVACFYFWRAGRMPLSLT
jgi:hypothetical protein